MLATYQTIAFAGMAFGSWGWGVLAERIGLRESLTIAGGVAFVSLLAARWLPVSVASLDLDPASPDDLVLRGVIIGNPPLQAIRVR